MYIENNKVNEKNINQINFYFVEEGPGRGSEDIQKECSINCFDFFFFFCLFIGRQRWKNHSQLQRTTLSRERTLELRQ
jgi:hypothetical protein